jgi:glycosyltransferase involved in cell wall biosynthesis
MDKHPKISIVTISYNQADFLEQTILSVIGQNYPNLEYIIIDGGSTDQSVNIIRKYEKSLAFWVSEKDNGMYEALQKGFKKSTGEIMGWINSDDLLLGNSLFVLAGIFSENPNCNWLEGTNTVIDESGKIINQSFPYNTTKYCFYKWNFLNNEKNNIRSFGTLQQESTYWRRSLWEKSGSKLDVSLKTAGDFELWMRFFRSDSLFLTKSQIGAFRSRTMQKSIAQKDVYLEESIAVINRELKLLGDDDLKILKNLELIERFPVLNKVSRIRKYYSKYMTSKNLLE